MALKINRLDDSNEVLNHFCFVFFGCSIEKTSMYELKQGRKHCLMENQTYNSRYCFFPYCELLLCIIVFLFSSLLSSRSSIFLAMYSMLHHNILDRFVCLLNIHH